MGLSSKREGGRERRERERKKEIEKEGEEREEREMNNRVYKDACICKLIMEEVEQI